MRGNALTFRFRDSTDFSSSGMTGEPSAADVLLGVGDGVQRRFELIKTYGDGESRRITRPIHESVGISVNGVSESDWDLVPGGIIEFTVPPSSGVEVRAGYLFDVPVRFEEPSLRVSRKTYLAGELASVPLVEVRES
jgi:uncharacterized protein (TIGR02217 family)